MTDQRSVRTPEPLPDGVSLATIGVRGGILRSQFEETAEALYLASGYVYDSAVAAEKAFAGETDRYVYSRYGNPTITMFEERLRLIEGAPAAFATASGMAAVFTSLGALLAAGDRLVASRLDDERRSQLQRSKRGTSANQCAAAHSERLPDCHVSTPIQPHTRRLRFWSAARQRRRGPTTVQAEDQCSALPRWLLTRLFDA